MPAAVREQLNANQQRFAQAIAMGSNYTEAYKQVFRTQGLPEETVRNRASNLANNPHVQQYAKGFIEQLNISAIDNANKFVIELINDIERCRANGKYAALAALMRIRGQVLGILKENVNFTSEQRLSDEELVKRMAGNDKGRAAVLLGILNSATGYKQA